MEKIYYGSRLFELKATHGLPLEVALDRLFHDGFSVDWCEFIDCARSNGWYDFQTINVIKQAMDDCMIEPYIKESILVRAKVYIMQSIKGAA